MIQQKIHQGEKDTRKRREELGLSLISNQTIDKLIKK